MELFRSLVAWVIVTAAFVAIFGLTYSLTYGLTTLVTEARRFLADAHK